MTREQKRQYKNMMYRLKIDVYAVHYGHYTVKAYFRDAEEAARAKTHYTEELTKAINGDIPMVDIEGTVFKSSIINGYRIKIRAPKTTDVVTIPDKMDDEDDD